MANRTTLVLAMSWAFMFPACHREIRRVGAFPAGGSGIAVSLQPSQLFAPTGLTRVQSALVQRGFLQQADVSENLDSRTREALVAFQSSQQLAQTGLPNHRTVRALGLTSDQVFRDHEPVAAGSP